MTTKNQILLNILYDIRSLWAVILYAFGKKHSCSTFIDKVSITAGYGHLDSMGDFKYPLSQKYIKKIYDECTKWNDWNKKNNNYY